MTNYNKLYIQSLIDFILDTKPYHSKLTEVIQELKFSESISVKVKDKHEIKTILSSIWSEDYYSDGARTRFLLPPFFNPRYSLEANQYKNPLEIDYLIENFGLPNCYQLGNSQGVESAYVNDSIKIEGLDYYVSKGIYSFSTHGTSYYKSNSTIQKDGAITYSNYSENPYMAISDINVKVGSESFWKIHILDYPISNFLTSNNIFNLKLKSNDFNFFYRIIQNGQYVTPKDVFNINDLETNFIFDDYTKKDIYLIPSKLDFVYSITGLSSSWLIKHNLKAVDIIPLVFVSVNNSYFEIDPDNITIVDNNSIVITLPKQYTGKVIIKKAFKQIKFNNTDSLLFNNVSKKLKFKVFGSTSNNLYLLKPEYDLTDKLTINFNNLCSGIINFYDESFETFFSVLDLYTNQIIGHGFNNSHFISSGLSFYANFGSVLEIGESSIIRPSNEIAIRPNIEDETWSIIKINPIPFKIHNNSIIVKNRSNSNISIIPYAPHFINSPAEIWTFTFNAGTFSISGSVSGSVFSNIKLGPWYENDYLKIKIVNPNIIFDASKAYDQNYLDWYTDQCKDIVQDGDSFTLEILDKKPNYLVYGSKSKHFDFATIGEYFWNGKIGFMSSKPYYRINNNSFIDPVEHIEISSYDESEYGEYYDLDLINQELLENIVFENNKFWFLEDSYPLQWNIYKGKPLLNNELQIEFNYPPRFDASDERFIISYDNNKNSKDQFNVYSNLLGQLPSATLGYTYTNFETTKVSENNNKNISFILNSNASASDLANLTITVDIVSNFIKGSHSKDVIIFTEPVNNLLVNTFNNDKLQFEIFNRKSFDLGYSEFDTDVIPTFIKLSKLNPNFLNENDNLNFGTQFQKDQFPGSLNRSEAYDLLLNNSTSSKVGTISNVYDPDVGFNRKVIDFDLDFANSYLPINTKFKFTSLQTDLYNHQVGTLITEEVKWTEKVKFSDIISVNVIDSILNIPGYDTSDYDTNFYDLNEEFSTLLILNRDIFPIISEDSNLIIRKPFTIIESIYDSIKLKISDKFLLNTDTNLIAKTKISDNGLSIVSKYISADQSIPNLALYDIPEYYDMGGYELNYEGIIFFEKMDSPILSISDKVSVAIIELIGYTQLQIYFNIDNLTGSILTPKTDYEIVNIGNNTVEIIFLKDPQPVIFIASANNSYLENLASYDIPEFYDMSGYELNNDGITIFRKMNYPILPIYENISIATIELIGYTGLKIATNINNLEGSLLIPSVDYSITNIGNNTFEIIFLKDPKPVIFIAE